MNVKNWKRYAEVHVIKIVNRKKKSNENVIAKPSEEMRTLLSWCLESINQDKEKLKRWFSLNVIAIKMKLN